VYIPGEFSCIVVGIHEDCFVSALKEVSISVVSLVEIAGISSVYVSHDPREISLRGGQQKVIVVAHKAIYVYDCLVAVNSCFEIDKKTLAVFIIPKDVSSFVAPGGDMVEGSWIFYS
jgi:hypothetical protein